MIFKALIPTLALLFSANSTPAVVLDHETDNENIQEVNLATAYSSKTKEELGTITVTKGGLRVKILDAEMTLSRDDLQQVISVSRMIEDQDVSH